ncbi:MAG: hypothetical protein N2D54_12945, partial [Chloroflexota bacterium]
LRNQGVSKILDDGNLEGGIYDLSLAEKIGPLDVHANTYREWARLYILGNSFYGAYPETAAQYFGQLAASAPNLQDASGETAFFRYWMSLIHIADFLAAKDEFCNAKYQYQSAFEIYSTDRIAVTAHFIEAKCIPTLTPSPIPSQTASPTPTKKPKRSK